MLNLRDLATRVHFLCPYCDRYLDVRDWYFPGMRTLGEMRCARCHTEYYGDLPVGHGLYHPMLLEKESGIVHDAYGTGWFSRPLQDSYANRTDIVVGFREEQFKEIRRPILLNCVDFRYGHSLLKLLNAQFYLDHHTDFDLILLIPPFLRWLVPDGVAAVWTVDLPLVRGTEWNDWIAAEIQTRLAPYEDVWISVAFSHPHPEDFDIHRFTKIKAFPLQEWVQRWTKPAITFIWREDRLWSNVPSMRWSKRQLRKIFGRTSRRAERLDSQNQQVIELAEFLRANLPNLDFAIVGLGQSRTFPAWITDMRTTNIDEQIEHAWCERYAASHTVVGVHGSNMLLPSGHAGSTIELMPKGRWGNYLQDIVLPEDDSRHTMFRYRVLSAEISPAELGRNILSLITDYPYASVRFNRPWTDHSFVTKNPLDPSKHFMNFKQQ